VAAPSAESEPALSIIVPVLNEAQRLGTCLAPLRGHQHEIIIADGGSDDAGLELLPTQVRLISCPRGRARQMNAAARLARGKLLVFVHADTRLTAPAWRRLQSLASSRKTVWGRFDVRLSGCGWMYRLIAACMTLRSRLSGISTGDQVLFVSANLFRACGGFPDIALMEDIAICRRLKAFQAPLCCREQVIASSRRWRRDGILQTIVLMWRLRLAYYLGVDPRQLAGRYYRESRF